MRSRRTKRRRDSGMTLVETIVAMGLVTMVLLILATLVNTAAGLNQDSTTRNQNIQTANTFTQGLETGLNDTASVLPEAQVNARFGGDEAVVVLTRDRERARWTCRAWWLDDDGTLWQRTGPELATNSSTGRPIAASASAGFSAASSPASAGWQKVADASIPSGGGFTVSWDGSTPYMLKADFVIGTKASYRAQTTITLDSGWYRSALDLSGEAATVCAS